MREKKTVAAFMYDFDNTLSTKDMQGVRLYSKHKHGRKGFLGGVQYVREKI